MARGNRTYKRDANGRFASTGGGGKRSRPAAKRVERGPNKLTRDNSGKITSVGGNGATARGGRLRTASGNLRATQTTRIAGGRAGMVGKGGKAKDVGNIVRTVMADKSLRSDKQRTAEMIRRGISPKSDFVKLVAANTTISSRTSKTVPMRVVADNSSRLPASQRPGSMTNTLRGVMGSLAKEDAKRIREVEAITGQKVRATKSNVGTAASNRVRATGAGSKSVSQTLRAGLRELAQSDARTMRGMAEIVRNSTPKLSGGKGLSARGKLRPAANPKPAQLPAATGRRKPLKNVGSALKNNLKGFAGLPVQVRSRKQAAAAQQLRTRNFLRGTAWKTGEYKSASRSVIRPLYKMSTTSSKQGSLMGGTDTVKRSRFKYAGEASYKSKTEKISGSQKRSVTYNKNAPPLEGTAKGKAYKRTLGIARRSQEGQDSRIARVSSRADEIVTRRGTVGFPVKPKEVKSAETRIRANKFIRNAYQNASNAGGPINAIRNPPKQSTASKNSKSESLRRRRKP